MGELNKVPRSRARGLQRTDAAWAMACCFY